MKYIEKLRNSGLRPTKQRLQICEVLFNKAKTFHFTINELDKKIKKQIRDGNEINQLELVKELGDVLFYVTALANHIGSDLQTVATNNIAKLHDRQKRNKLQGSGDNR